MVFGFSLVLLVLCMLTEEGITPHLAPEMFTGFLCCTLDMCSFHKLVSKR